jgi:hypothetical protein
MDRIVTIALSGHATAEGWASCVQDPGNAAFNLNTGDMEALVRRLKDDGSSTILSANGEPVKQGSRIAMFFQDLNGFILEATQSTRPRIRREAPV